MWECLDVLFSAQPKPMGHIPLRRVDLSWVPFVGGPLRERLPSEWLQIPGEMRPFGQASPIIPIVIETLLPSSSNTYRKARCGGRFPTLPPKPSLWGILTSAKSTAVSQNADKISFTITENSARKYGTSLSGVWDEVLTGNKWRILKGSDGEISSLLDLLPKLSVLCLLPSALQTHSFSFFHALFFLSFLFAYWSNSAPPYLPSSLSCLPTLPALNFKMKMWQLQFPVKISKYLFR